MKPFLLLLSVIVGVLSVHAVRYNWTAHARFDLLLHGYVFCELKSADQIKELPESSHAGFVAKWVYVHGVCVGHLDRYGEFVSINATDNVNPSATLTKTLLFACLEWGLIIVFTGMCIHLVLRLKNGHSK